MRRAAIDDAGWLRGARHVPSPHCDARPEGTAVELVVLHSISLPPGEYGGDAIERLFTGRLDFDAHPYYAQLRGLRVSAHFVVDRSGGVTQYVACAQRAWHAGVSQWNGRQRCNDYSVGIELEGLEGERFSDAQYEALMPLLRALAAAHSLAAVVGHEHIAPGRKHDPGAGFDWTRLRTRLRWPRALFP